MENKQTARAPLSIRHYFVDEGGDSTLFSKTGKTLVGTEGCSRFFILGLLDVPDPVALNDRIDDTRKTDYGVYYTQNKPLTAEVLRERK